MKIRIIKFLSVISLSFFTLTSCSSWLSIKPEDRVTEDQLFSTVAGFRSALNGIYLEMNASSLYGGHMLYDGVEVIAQRYDLSGMSESSELVLLANYEYNEDAPKAMFQNIWEKYYSLISNCNRILEYANRNTNILFGETRDVIVGETLALRAFFHFDLLRLFGPVYAINSTGLAIPYNTNYTLSAEEISTAEKVIERILIDLKEAKAMLGKSDPIIKYGPRLEDSADGLNVDTYRTQRLNFYAVTALMARVNLYAGNKSAALSDAKEVVEVQQKWFPFIKRTLIVDNTKNPDRVFSSELLFSLTNSKRSDIFTKKFSPENTSGIYAAKKYLSSIFGEVNDKDWRYSPMWILPVGNQSIDYRCFHKYEAIESADYWKNIVPLIRISEMYYIIAETTTDNSEALWAMNQVYVNRGLNSVDQIEDLSNAIRDEYVKEFYGEGQLFFYYKRLNISSITSFVTGKVIQMGEAQYVIPLPKSETDYRD